MWTFRKALAGLKGSRPEEKNFRLRLLLAMMLVVSAMTGATLYFAQRGLARETERTVREEFRSTFANILEVQAAHRAMLAERCRSLATSLRTRSALEDGDIEALYLNGEIELRALLERSDDPGEGSPLRVTFFRFLNAKGEVLPPPDNNDGALLTAAHGQLAAAAGLDAEQVAYLAVQGAHGRQRIDELVAAPITATDTGEIIGTLALGFRPARFSPAPGSLQVRSGVWLEGHLQMPAVPADVVQKLATEVTRAISAASEEASIRPVQVGGLPHLILIKHLNPKSRFAPAYEVCLYSMSQALARQKQLRWQILGAGALLLCAGLVASHLLATQLSAPVERLAVDSAANRAGRERAEAELMLTNEELVARNVELQAALVDLKTTQQHVIQQERLRALGQMASGIAHDFNNALVPILGFCELLQIRPDILADRAKALSYLETIQTAAKDAASVVSRLREFYRGDKGEKPFTPVNLKRLVEQTITLTRPRWKEQAQAAGINIEVALELEMPPPVAGDESALREVLTNLIFNAVDAMPEGGTLTLRTRAGRDAAILEVADTGTGMTEEVRQRCLEPFFSTKGEHGTGLGLAMVFGIIQRHSAHLELESTPGKGTCFSLQFPLMDANASTAETTSVKTRRGLKILLVDDEAAVRDTLSAILLTDGHEVAMENDGAAGLKRFGADKFDLVITDKAMPQMNGDQMAAAIKRSSPRTPIILLTGFGLFYEKKDFPHIDVLASKPVRIPTLREAITNATATA